MTVTNPVPPPKIVSGIFVKEVRVRNFRCLKAVDVELDYLTILIGQNNAGKTSFLNAICAAIGAGQRVITEEDIFLAKNEPSIPKQRAAVIDILVRPSNGKEIIDSFPQGSPWLELWGNGIVQDEADCDLAAIRTEFKWNSLKGEYTTERRFLKDWQTEPSKWELSKPMEKVAPVGPHHIEPLAIYMLDARRDMVEDLRSRSSLWHKMVSDHGLDAEAVERIETALSEINKEIVGGSAVLSHVEMHLSGFHDTIACDKESIAVTPIARHLRDLSRGMDVMLSTEGAPAFPPHKQGMGTRSLGAVLIFSAYVNWKQQQSEAAAVHPMTALEEPECHLHPHAQRALLMQIRNMPGQKLVSTHSPYISSQVEITQMRHFSKRGEETIVSSVDVDSGATKLTKEELRQIDRQVMNTRGDMLFAKALVFFEGETEEQALPDFAERHWKRHINELGLSFIGVGGDGKYLPFLRMAKSFGIPWFIFSDGEPNTIKNVNVALAAAHEPDASTNPRVVIIEKGQNFETYLVAESSSDALVKIIIDHRAKAPQHRSALENQWKNEPNVKAAVIQELTGFKTQYGSIVGRTLAVPGAVAMLFEKINIQIGGTMLVKVTP